MFYSSEIRVVHLQWCGYFNNIFLLSTVQTPTTVQRWSTPTWLLRTQAKSRGSATAYMSLYATLMWSSFHSTCSCAPWSGRRGLTMDSRYTSSWHWHEFQLLCLYYKYYEEQNSNFLSCRAADACIVFNYECKGDGTMRALIFEFRNTTAVWMFALFPLNNTVYQTIKDNWSIYCVSKIM